MAELRFDITGDSSGAQRANRQYATSADLAARGARLLAESLDKQKRAAAVSAAATIAAAKADRILADAEDDAIASHVRLRTEQDKLRTSLEKTTSKGLLGGLFGAGGSAASAGASAASGLLGGGGDITAAVKGIGATVAGGIAAALAPALLPTFAGGGIGILGAVLGDPKAVKKTLTTLTATIKTAIAPLKPAFGGIFSGLDKFIKSQGPQLRDLFRASLPFLGAFTKILEQAATTILPAVTQSLKQMAPSLPFIVQGFTAIFQGIADMIKAIGPRGMEASAKLFVDVARSMGFALTVFGKVLNFTTVTVFHTVHAIHQQWDELRHRTADAFGEIRHYVSSSWDATWRDTIGRAQSGIATVVGFFKALPGRILGALTGLGHSLYGFAHAALNDLWSGFKAVGGAIISWLGGFVSRIIGSVKKLLGIGSPSAVFHEIGVNMMLGLERGIKATAHKAADAAQGAVGGAAGPTSASAAQAQAYARSRLGAFGWSLAQMAPLAALWNQESGWNRFARNPTSGAYGIPQALPPGKMGPAANPPTSSAAAQINWGLGYIKSVYGSPAGAWAHERAFNWYGKGGIIPEPVLGVGLRSGRGYGFGEHGPEMVVPRGGGGGGKTVLELRPSRGDAYGQFLINEISRLVRDNGGDVNTVFGTSY